MQNYLLRCERGWMLTIRLPAPVTSALMLAAALPSSFFAGAAPVVPPIVTTVHPVYLIAREITAGIEDPVELVPGPNTGHDMQLTPGQRQLLKSSNMILWVDPAYETTLAGVLARNPDAVMLSQTPGLVRLPLRTRDGKAIAGTFDPHIWLSPANAAAIARHISAVRSRQYPARAAAYAQNYQKFISRLKSLPAAEKPANYLAYHDAYQYLEKDSRLKFGGALVATEDQTPSAATIVRLQQDRQATGCIIAGQPAALRKLQQVSPARKQVLVSEVLAGASSYTAAMQGIANSLASCRTAD